MEGIRLIACDLDGTLLLDGAQRLQPETCGLIRRLHDRGILFFAASGRQYSNLLRLFAPVRDQIGYLCENGCLAFYKGERIFRERMDRSLGQEIIRAIQATDGAEVLLSGEKVSYLQPKDPRYVHHMRDVVGNDVELVPDLLETAEEYMKISVYEENGIQDAEHWKALFGDRCTVVTGGNAWLDMMPLHVNKGTGLRRILSSLSILPEQCMAIGDNENDREMLELAGFPVAVRSAWPPIREIARMETDTVEHLMERLLSGRNPACP